MADKLVMGYWDCPYCDEKGIKGTLRECPNCGHPRAENTIFYMKSKNHEEVVANNEYLTEAESATKGKGEDWECSYCGGLNSVLDTTCRSCGHARDDADAGYSEMRKRKEEQDAHRAAAKTQPLPSAKIDSFFSRIPKFVYVIVALFVVLGAIGFAAMPRDKDLHVTDKSWEFAVEVEHYVYSDESGWSLPSDAENVRTSEEVHHYDQVLDHYETKTETYQERVQSGSHTEYTYSSNGDGTFTEHAHTVPDYTYETRTRTYKEPVYRSVPVYQTKYYYKAWRWKHAKSYTRSGSPGEELSQADIEQGLADNERASFTSRKFFLTGYLGDDDGKSAAYEVDEQRYQATSIGDTLSVKVTLGDIITSFNDELGGEPIVDDDGSTDSSNVDDSAAELVEDVD